MAELPWRVFVAIYAATVVMLIVATWIRSDRLLSDTAIAAVPLTGVVLAVAFAWLKRRYATAGA